MKDVYIVAEKSKEEFLKIYDEYYHVASTMNIEEAKFSQKRLNTTGKIKTKIYKLVEVK